MKNNTKVSFMYRDGANYKTHTSVVFSGALPLEQMLKLKEVKSFIPEYYSIAGVAPDELDEEYDSELDHPYHEITNVELTNDKRTVMKGLEEFYYEVINNED